MLLIVSPRNAMTRWKLLFLLVFGATTVGAQTDTTAYKKRKLDPVEMNILYGYYDQNGYHSAITGGVGSEKLDVHSSTFDFIIPVDTNIDLTFELGIDVITSASTDKIDFIMSSASEIDGHHHAKLGYQHQLGEWKYGLAYSYAMESDYFSNGAHFNISRTSKDRNTTVAVAGQVYFDYVTWGWHQFEGNVKPIIPAELRFRNVDYGLQDNRYSYNFSLSLTRNITKRLNGGLFFSPAYQTGQLATPYHRVYLSGIDEAVIETLPNSRIKIPVGIRANYFAFDKIIFRWMYRFYWDDFGVVSHMTGLDLPIKISPTFTLDPFYRFYNQSASTYFAGYSQNQLGEEFYTSDFDLSAFSSHKFGLGIRISPPKGILRLNKKGYSFRRVSLRYAHYMRTDGLSMHIFGSIFNFGG